MTDREMLELAAKAAGLHIDKSAFNGGGSKNDGFDLLGNVVLDWHNGKTWNPLTDSGQALELAVKLGISIEPYPVYETPKHSVICKQRRRSDQMREANPTEVVERYADSTPVLATCLAITRCAAEIGRTM